VAAAAAATLLPTLLLLLLCCLVLPLLAACCAGCRVTPWCLATRVPVALLWQRFVAQVRVTERQQQHVSSSSSSSTSLHQLPSCQQHNTYVVGWLV